MANLLEGKALRQLVLGKRVDRAAATHAAATTPYFTVHTGRVLVTCLVGHITVASGANICSWVANPTIGTATQVLCAGLDINPAIVGDSLTITGVVASAMTYGTAAGLPAMIHSGIICLPGTIDFIAAAADGATSWALFYVPIDDGAYVTAT
jgi:hypothetical protein